MTRDLETVSAQWLLEHPLPKRPWVVDSLLSTGLHILAGEPKVGKSWLVLDLALCVSTGRPIWGFCTTKGPVLYLCLEDTYERIQDRLEKMADGGSEDLYFCRRSESLDDGLNVQIMHFIRDHEGTMLVIIDTLQMVRRYSGENMYMADYSDLSKLKKVADDMKIALLLVHHRRKMPDNDVFKTISGSTGITGSADSSFVLYRQNGGTKESVKQASLAMTGRDTAERELDLMFDETYHWICLGERSEKELAAARVPREVYTIIEFVKTLNAPWQGLASELIAETDITGANAMTLGRQLNRHHAVLGEAGIKFSRKKTSRGSEICLSC